MHVRHEALFGWLMDRFPETRLYGPYHHGGRSYYQWMARGPRARPRCPPAARRRASRRTRRLRRRAVRGHVRRATRDTSRASATAWRGPADPGPGKSGPGGDAAARVAALAERYALPDDAVRASPGVPSPARRGSARADRRPGSAQGDRRPPRGLAGRARARADPLGRGRSPTSGPAPAFPGWRSRSRCPGTRFSLVESASRRCAFLERAVAASETTNAVVVNTRAETWPEGLARFDVVTARALAPLPVVVEYAAPLLIVGGTLVVWRGKRNPRRRGRRRAGRGPLGLEPTEIRHMQPFPGAENRYLHLMSKVTETPLGFPRRPGMALKRPLGAS